MIYCDLQGLQKSKVIVQMKGYIIMSFYLSIIVPNWPNSPNSYNWRLTPKSDLKVTLYDVT